MSAFKTKDIPDLASKALGYSSYTEFNKVTDLYIKVARDNGELVDILINNDTDFFAKSYSRESSMCLTWRDREKDPFQRPDNILLLKTRIKAKVKQQNVIFRIKEQAIIDITQYISDTFEIDPSVIDRSDIKFTHYSSFEVAGNPFYFSSMLTGNLFKINESRYITHRESFILVTGITKYFTEKVNNS